MTGIYLVEDEIYALKALQQKIIDLNEDYVIVGSADNGVTALEQIPALCPDIVITDIRMPDIDGLTLISRLKEAGSSALPVIVSGYQDFEYAKQAIRLGAADYLLKPVNPPELAACLKNCVDKIARQRKNIVSFLIGEEHFSLESSLLADSFTLLYLIMANPLTNVENTLHPNVSYLPNERLEQLFIHFNRCRFFRCFDGFFSNEKVILFCSDEKSSSFLAGNLPHFCKELTELTGQYVTVYYTSANCATLPSLIRECREKAARCVFLGENTLHTTPVKALPAKGNIQETADLLALMINQGQLDTLHSNIRRLLQSWRQEKRTCLAITENLLLIINILNQKFTAKSYPDFSNRYLLENVISFSADYETLADNFFNLLTALFTSTEPEAKPAQELVDSLITYLNEHISSNITLQDLEELTGFSKVYICRIFKKFRNTTPIDYFTRLKIARAQKMLTGFPNLSLREISDSLGFNDVYYFSKVFKKITGSSPSELRSGHTE